MVEYVLPPAIIMIVLIVILSTVNPQFRQALSGFYFEESGSSATNSHQLSVKSFGSNPLLKTVQFKMADGTTIMLDDYPTDLAQLVETEGTDGTTSTLARLLQSLASKLSAQGKLTPIQANLLANLANRGFDLAKIESHLEDCAIKAHGDPNAFINNTLSINGEVKPALSLIKSLGSHSTELLGEAVALTPDDKYALALLEYDTGNPYMGSQHLAFLRAYEEVSKTNALQDPAVQNLVNRLSHRILTISQLMATTSINLYNTQSSPDQLRHKLASALTNSHSTTICNTGGTQAKNDNCPQ